MREFLFSVPLPDGVTVCVSQISPDAFQGNELDHLGDDSGYFIYEYDTERSESGFEVLAKTVSYDAAMRLVEIFHLARRMGVDRKSHFRHDASIFTGAP